MLYPLPAEIAFSYAVQSFISPGLTSLMIAFTWLGSPTVWIGLAMGLYWLQYQKLAIRVLILSVITAVFVEGFKTIFGRMRPGSDFVQLYNDGISTKSFPSGHATLASAQVMHLIRMEKAPALFGLLGAALVMGVAISRVYLGLHFVGDVIVGVLLGIVLGRAYVAAHEHKIIQSWKKKIQSYKYVLLIMFITLIGLGVMLLQKEIGSIAATLGFLVGFFLFEEENLEMKPLPFDGLNMVKVILGMFSTSLFVLLNWQLVGSVAGYGFVSFAVYFLAGIYAVSVYPWIWNVLVPKKIRTRS